MVWAGTWCPPSWTSSLSVRPKKDTDGYSRSASLMHRSSSFSSFRSCIVAGRSSPGGKIDSISSHTRSCTSGWRASRNSTQLMPAVVVSCPFSEARTQVVPGHRGRSNRLWGRVKREEKETRHTENKPSVKLLNQAQPVRYD